VSRDPRVTLFKAADAFTHEAYKICGAFSGAVGLELAKEIRRVALRSGGALVAASGSVPGGAEERELLLRARTALIEGRYYVYLARRFGMLDVRGYRSLTTRQDAALRELGQLLPSAAAEALPP